MKVSENIFVSSRKILENVMNMDLNKVAIISGGRRVSFAEMFARIQSFADVSRQSRGSKTIIFSENREGWVYALYSAWLMGSVPVPVDVMSTVSDVEYILRDCTPEYVWSSKKKADVVRQAIQQSGLDIQLFLIDDYETVPVPSFVNVAGNTLVDGFRTLYYQHIDDMGLIVYTSGTTGTPKGVMLSYGNMLANVRAVSEEVPIYGPEVRSLVLLPLHHILPLMGTIIAPMINGAGITISPSMTGPDIMATLQTGDVHIIIGVPRLWQTIYNGVKSKIDSSPIARLLFWVCEKADNPALSRKVFKAVHQKLGGRLQFCVNGGAALPKEVAQGMKTLGLDLLDGYGMTEMSPMISFTRPGELVPGSVGKAMPSVQVKYVDGELCAKGPNLMLGYYNRPKETAAVIDSEGYIHTGDVAHADDEGHIFITGRTKEIIVLSNGKNINPVEIEYKIEGYEEMVKEVGVCQDGDRLCAIIVPNELWARGKSDEEIELQLKREVIEPYNQETESYKRVLSVYIYHGELPRTRMEKLQRYKLPLLLKSGAHSAPRQTDAVEPTFEEYRILKKYIEEEKHIAVHASDSLDTDLALDSLDMVGLQAFIEITFGLKMNSERISGFHTIGQLAEYVSDYKTRVEVDKIDWAAILNEDTSAVRLPRTWATANMIVATARTLSKGYFSLSGKGMENIPDGPYIMAPNHQSYLDGMFVTAFLTRSQVNNSYFYAKADHVKSGFAQFMASHHNVVVLDLNNLKESIQTLGEALKRGKNVIVFPEGTRTVTGKLGTFKKMFAILSKELNVPIVPVAISGAYEAMPKGSKMPKRGKVTVEFLKPIQPQATDTYASLTDKVHDAIAAVLH